MASQRFQLPIPLGGLSRNTAKAEQPAGTSDELLNVRGIDPKTGRVRLSQRAGSSKLVESQVIDGKVDELQSVAYDVPRVSWSQVLESHGIEWSDRAGPRNEVLDVQTDRQGNVLCLTPDGTVTKYNSAGEEVDSFRPPVPAVNGTPWTVVSRLVVDEFDFVYVAATYVEAVAGERWAVWKYGLTEAPDGTDLYTQSWELGDTSTDAEFSITDFDVRVGQLALLGENTASPAGWQVQLYFSIYTGSPLLAWTATEVPDTCNRLRISPAGDVFVVFEPDDTRGSGNYGAGYTRSQIDWWFHDEAASENRLHALMVPDLMQAYVDGQRVTEAPDHRWAATNATADDLNGQPPGYITDAEDVHTNAPNDTAPNRYLYNDDQDAEDLGIYLLRPPTWRSGSSTAGIGSLAGIAFDATEAPLSEFLGGSTATTGNVLISRAALNFPYKSDTTTDGNSDGEPDSDGTNSVAVNVLPVNKPEQYDLLDTGSIELPGNGYTFTASFELSDDSEAANQAPQVLITSCEASGTATSQFKWALLHNVTWSAGFSTEIGTLCFYYEIEGTAAALNMPKVDWDPSDTAADRGGTGIDTAFLVFSFVHGGTVVPAGTVRTNQSSVRFNGRCAGRFTVDTTSTSNSGQANTNYILFGNPYAWRNALSTNNPYTPWADITGITNIAGFRGKMGMYAVMMHPDQTATNPTAANGAPSLGYAVDTGWGFVQPRDNTSGTDIAAPAFDASGTALNSGSVDSGDYGTTRSAKETFTQTATTVERMEGCIAHYYGSGDVLPDTGGSNTQDGTTDLWDDHPFGGSRVPVGDNYGFIGNAANIDTVINSTRGGLVKYSGANGTPVWGLNGSGIGYGVTTDSLGFPMTVGPTEEGKTVRARKVVDNGSDYSTSTSSGAWTSEGSILTYKYPILRADSAGALYIPVINTTTTSTVQVLKSDAGTEEYTVNLPNSGQRVASVAFPPLPLPQYLNDAITGPEFMYVGSNDAGSQDLQTIHKYRLVAQTQNVADGLSLRRHDLVVVGAGDIKRISNGVLETATDGAGALLSSPYVQAVQLFGEVFITDGEKIVVLNPRTNTVLPYKPLDGGEVPERIRILTAWRGRLIFARSSDYPYEITASELGNPYGLNIYPAAPSVTQAFRVTAAGVGRAPDIINSFIPLTDDLALLGGDHSLHVITGDPAAGGSVDVISDQVGAAFGNAWTKGPQGECYIFTSRGGVIVVPPGGNGFQRLSLQRIERTLQDIDLTLFKMRLVWDYRREGLIVCPVPWERLGEKHRSWFWEQKTGAWWEDEWDTTSLQPSALTIFDGDNPDDRRVIMGCEDGYIRYIDEASASDDGTRIRSKALIGPLVPPGSSSEFRFMRPQVTLASDQSGADYEFLSSSTADQPGEWWARGPLTPGRGEFIAARTRGSAVWLRILNERTNERWSLEDATVEVTAAGRMRAR